MTGNRTRRFAALAMAVVLITTAFAGAGTVAADHNTDDDDSEDSIIDRLFSTDDESEESGGFISSLSTVRSAVSGWADKNTPLGQTGEKASASEYAGNTAATFNENRSALANWTNQRVNASEEQNVVRVTFTDTEDNSRDLYVVAGVNNSTGDYTEPVAVNQSVFADLNRSVDLNYTLSPYASRNANMELETFIQEYATTGETPDTSYFSHLVGEYRGEVTGTDLPGTDDTEQSGWSPWSAFGVMTAPGVTP